MKTKMLILSTLVGLFIISTTGCVGPYYDKQSQYDKGKWHFLASNKQVHERELQILAREKLKDQPVQVEVTTNGVFRGFIGIIANLSSYPRLRFTYDGPEHGVEVLSQGEQIVKPLLPGVYTGEIFHGGTRVGWIQFISEPQEKGFMGKRYHWIFYAERW